MSGPPGGPAAPLRLLIADDQPLIRRGMAMILAAEAGVEVVGQAADGDEAVALALETRPDVVVMDLRMPRTNGVVATRRITEHLPGTQVVVLTTYDDDEWVFNAICAGAQAYLLKDADETELIDTIRAVQRGESRLAPRIAAKVMQQFRRFAERGEAGGRDPASRPPDGGGGPAAPPPAPSQAGRPGHDTGARGAASEPLTEKESKILELIARGLSNKQIAAEVFLAEGTVKNYVSRIMDKLHAESRYQLAARAHARGREG